MSGVVGIYFRDGRPVDSSDLNRMLAAIAHRGPDGSGCWFRGSAGLGHRMLWTTPESLHERLPLADETGELAITADARIDNREELISSLDLNGRPPDSISDSELILRAYEKWGDRCPETLLGDFAFAIWDARRQALFCARDHFGVKPFYYYRCNRTFIFGSEIKALLCLQEVPRRLNEVRVADYLVSMLQDKEITFYQDIVRLPPAHSMKVSRDGVELRSYWALDPTREVNYNSNEEYAEAFREIFTEAVRCRLRSAFPIGSMLSGGLDSSSIVCVGRQLLHQNGNGRLHTFSATFKDVPECDERTFINSVLAQGDQEPHFVRADQLSPLADVNRILWHEDEAFYAPNLFMHWSLYKAAGEQGVRILFDGLDGDTTVSHGLTHLATLMRRRRWKPLAAEIDGLSRYFHVSRLKLLWLYSIKPAAPEGVRQLWRRLRQGSRNPWTHHTILSADFSRRIGLAGRAQALLGDDSRLMHNPRGDHFRRLNSGAIPFFLEVADKAAAAFCIRPHYPFFDKRLVEFCLALPPEQKLNGGWTRVVMRRAMGGLLPSDIQWRGGKSNLSLNFNRGLLRFERDLLDQVIIRAPRNIQQYVDLAALRKAYRRYVAQGKWCEAMTVWKAVTLDLWLSRTGLTP